MSLTEISLNIPTDHMANVFGQFDTYMKKIERALNVTVVLRGENIKLIGEERRIRKAADTGEFESAVDEVFRTLPLLDAPFMKGMLGDRTFNAELMPVKDGDIIDLGGGYEVEVFTLGGHTPGSVVYLDRKRKIALTGDALGVWMQVPMALPISAYRDNLLRLQAKRIHILSLSARSPI